MRKTVLKPPSLQRILFLTGRFIAVRGFRGFLGLHGCWGVLIRFLVRRRACATYRGIINGRLESTIAHFSRGAPPGPSTQQVPRNLTVTRICTRVGSRNNSLAMDQPPFSSVMSRSMPCYLSQLAYHSADEDWRTDLIVPSHLLSGCAGFVSRRGGV